MSSFARWRSWHRWAGLIVLAPICVVAATGFLWNHEKTLGLKQEHGEGMEKPYSGGMSESPLAARSGTWSEHGAAIDAALLAARDVWKKDVPLDRVELKHEAASGLVVKVKAIESANVVPEEIVWSVAQSQIIGRKGAPGEGTDWAKIVHDLHTGKFFSKSLGYFWSDSASLTILFLGFSGVILFVVPILKRRGNRQRRVDLPVRRRPLDDVPLTARTAPQRLAAEEV